MTRPSSRTIRVVAAVIERDGKYLITQRRAAAVLPLLWEFPGGKVEEGERDEDALQREVRHRLGATIRCGELINFVSHPYEHYTVDLHLYACTLEDEVLEARAVNAFAWAASDDFDKFSFTPADEATMSKLLGLNN